MDTRVIRRIVSAAIVLLCASPWATAFAHAQAYGYVFGAPGAAQCCGNSVGTFHLGGGGEFVSGIGLGVGAEIGYLGPWEAIGDGFGVFSLNGSYYFSNRHAPAKLVPFVTGGYTLFFRDGSINLWNIGGGVNYWFNDGLALRVEFRDHIESESSETAHFWGARFGLSFGHR